MVAAQIDTLVADAIARRVFPGAVVLVAHGNTLLHWAGYGTTVYEPELALPVARDTIYDIASLTKVFTATAALRLFDAGQLDLHAPVAQYLPALRASDVTIWHLLTHTSGLDIRLSSLRHAGPESIWAAVYNLVPTYTPGTVVAYTNVNSLLLGAVVAQCIGMPLEHAFNALLLHPLGLRDTSFLPEPGQYARIAPTEYDHAWRRQLVHGTVHDESAHALGGVAGHAGLFSTASDLLQFCQMWLQAAAAVAPGTALLQPTTARSALTDCTAHLPVACGLGWMLDRPNFMGTVPPGTAGHTGFTGPALVLIPSEQLIVVVLNNRIYPQRSQPAHHAVIAGVVAAARQAVA